MASKKILLLGGGGHCRSVLDCLLSGGEYDSIGIIERELSDVCCLGVPVVGTDEDVPRLFREGWTHACVTLGSVGDPARRRSLLQLLRQTGFSRPPVVDPTAVIGRGAVLGESVFVGKRAVINTGAVVGTGAIVNTGAILEHDCTVGDFAHISPGCVLCGGVCVGENTHVGAGSVVRQQLRIGRDVMIGAGSVVVKDIPDGVKAYGNPCKIVEEL